MEEGKLVPIVTPPPSLGSCFHATSSVVLGRGVVSLDLELCKDVWVVGDFLCPLGLGGVFVSDLQVWSVEEVLVECRVEDADVESICL